MLMQLSNTLDVLNDWLTAMVMAVQHSQSFGAGGWWNVGSMGEA